MHEIEQQLQIYYGAKRLPEDRATAILADARRMRPLRFRVPWRLTLAAAAAVALIVWVGAYQFSRISGMAMTESLAAELAAHHLVNEPPAVQSGQYEEVQAALSRLPFAIIPTRSDLLQQYRLLGGRYCKLQDHLVVQLKLEDLRREGTSTLFVTDLTTDLRKIRPRMLYRDGVAVEIWAEGDRLFGLARTVNPEQAGPAPHRP